MKLWIGSAFLCLLIAAPTFARQEQQQDDKPKQQQQDEKKKPPQEPKADKRQQEEPARQQDDKAKQQDKKQEKQDTKQQEKQQKEVEKQQKTQDRQTEQQRPSDQRQTQQQRAPEQRTDTGAGRNEQYAGGGERGRRIPDDRFREHFGREHHFHVGIHRGERQFAYGGYSFELVDAWPARWGYNDDFYVDYIEDQYYLCDVEHPEIHVVVIVAS